MSSKQHDRDPLLQGSSSAHTSVRYGTAPRIDLDEEEFQAPDAGKNWMGSSIGTKFKKFAFGENRASVASVENDEAEHTTKDGKTGPMRFIYYIIYALV
jgi:hypothetical protein